MVEQLMKSILGSGKLRIQPEYFRHEVENLCGDPARQIDLDFIILLKDAGAFLRDFAADPPAGLEAFHESNSAGIALPNQFNKARLVVKEPTFLVGPRAYGRLSLEELGHLIKWDSVMQIEIDQIVIH